MLVKLIVIITVSVIVLFGIVSLYGKYQWQLETDRLRDRLTNGKQTITPKIYDPKELENIAALGLASLQAPLNHRFWD